MPYVGEIRLFGGNFAPVGWAFCEGQLLAIAENETLFNLIGTTYGGDGQETFALPDLAGRAPVHIGQGPNLASNWIIGEQAGAEQVTLTTAQLPQHGHALLASQRAGTRNAAAGSVPAADGAVTAYLNDAAGVNLAPAAITPVGGSQPHENMQPFLAVSYIISLFGIFPSPT